MYENDKLQDVNSKRKEGTLSEETNLHFSGCDDNRRSNSRSKYRQENSYNMLHTTDMRSRSSTELPSLILRGLETC
jgi:hypothetical protein